MSQPTPPRSLPPNPLQRSAFWLLSSLSLALPLLSLLSPALGELTTWGQPGADPSCRADAASIQQQTQLRQAASQGDTAAQRQYQQQLRAQAEALRDCRRQTWPRHQAIWLRLYPCDARPGILEAVLDDIVQQGYNQVYVEAFYDGRVLLPAAANPTVWPSVLTHPTQAQTDLLAEAIARGRERGLQVHAWVFTMNVGYSYATRPDRQDAIARNGRGQTSLDLVEDGSQVFIDPYNRDAQLDYYRLLEAILTRKPDGILFDYIRFPRGSGSASVVTQVKDLPIYSPAAQTALLNRATNDKGRALIQRFLDRGYITVGDLNALNQQIPQDAEPLWQGRNPGTLAQADLNTQQATLQQELWLLAVAHAYQGVTDFLSFGAAIAQSQGISSGAVFFPGGNQTVGQGGFDSRLQPWDRFPSTIAWAPMAYASCGHAGCIVDEVATVLRQATVPNQVQPALAGSWGRSVNGKPPLEEQMQALRGLSGQIDTVSHFAYSWLNPSSDQQRRTCRF